MKVVRVILVNSFLHRGSERKQFVHGKEGISLSLADRGVEVASVGSTDNRRYWVPLTNVRAIEVDADEAEPKRGPGRPPKADSAA